MARNTGARGTLLSFVLSAEVGSSSKGWNEITCPQLPACMHDGHSYQKSDADNVTQRYTTHNIPPSIITFPPRSVMTRVAAPLICVYAIYACCSVLLLFLHAHGIVGRIKAGERLLRFVRVRQDCGMRLHRGSRSPPNDAVLVDSAPELVMFKAQQPHC